MDNDNPGEEHLITPPTAGPACNRTGQSAGRSVSRPVIRHFRHNRENFPYPRETPRVRQFHYLASHRLLATDHSPLFPTCPCIGGGACGIMDVSSLSRWAGVAVSRGGPGQWGFVNLVRAGTQQP